MIRGYRRHRCKKYFPVRPDMFNFTLELLLSDLGRYTSFGASNVLFACGWVSQASAHSSSRSDPQILGFNSALVIKSVVP